MDNGFLGFIVFFLILALAGTALGNWDSIPAAVAEAELEGAAGPIGAQAVNKIVSLAVKFFLGAVFSGIALFVMTEGRKAYRLWKKDSRTRRWKPGPNAQWKPPQQPRLTKNDLMFMSLLGRMPPKVNQQKLSQQDIENDLDIDLS